MKILTSAQLRQLDEMTINIQQISSANLMERAASCVFDRIRDRYGDLIEKKFVMVCGKGNNGGDGLVLARLLDQAHADVQVYILSAEQYSADNLLNQQRLWAENMQTFDLGDRLVFPSGAIILDCLFGFGLTSPLAQKYFDVIDQMNHSGNTIISVDMPSGLLADQPTPSGSPVVEADIVYTFHAPKWSLLQPDDQLWVKSFEVVDIGLANDEAIYSEQFLVDLPLIKTWYYKRKKFDHKGVFGHLILVGGSIGKMGSVQLSAKAALRAGVGLLTIHIPGEGLSLMQSNVLEAMCSVDENENYIFNFPNPVENFTYGVGIGLGQQPETITSFLQFLKKCASPLVLDADALNILSAHPDCLKDLPKGSILTPHPKELSRLIGSWKNDFEKLQKVKDFASAYDIIMVVKGANTAIVLPSGVVYYNNTGNPGMATGGSGDVLTGIISSLLAQGYTSEKAAVVGVFLHGKAADIAIQTIGEDSLIPTDIIDFLPRAFRFWTS